MFDFKCFDGYDSVIGLCTPRRIINPKTSRLMFYRFQKPFAMVLLALSMAGLQAQDALPAGGGDASGGGGSSNCTVGQVAYTFNTGSTGSVAQGVQQPYEISVVTGTAEYEHTDLPISVYPNPTINALTLEVVDADPSRLSWKLYDLEGTLLGSDRITSRKTNIPAQHLPPGTYFIRVDDSKMEIRNFKIIKN